MVVVVVLVESAIWGSRRWSFVAVVPQESLGMAHGENSMQTKGGLVRLGALHGKQWCFLIFTLLFGSSSRREVNGRSFFSFFFYMEHGDILR